MLEPRLFVEFDSFGCVVLDEKALKTSRLTYSFRIVDVSTVATSGSDSVKPLRLPMAIESLSGKSKAKSFDTCF